MKPVPQLFQYVFVLFNAICTNVAATDDGKLTPSLPSVFLLSLQQETVPALGVLQEILDTYGSTCIIHLVDIADILKAHSWQTVPPYPLLVSSWNLRIEAWRSFAEAEQDQQNLHQMIQRHRFGGKVNSALKIRAFTCLVTLLLGKRLDLLTSTHFIHTIHLQQPVKTLLRQDVVFASEIFNYQRYPDPMVFLPEIYIVYDDDVNILEVNNTLDEFNSQILSWSAHMPPILFLGAVRESLQEDSRGASLD